MREIVLRERLLAYSEDLAEWFAGEHEERDDIVLADQQKTGMQK